jgi:hypothetical protein
MIPRLAKAKIQARLLQKHAMVNPTCTARSQPNAKTVSLRAGSNASSIVVAAKTKAAKGRVGPSQVQHDNGLGRERPWAAGVEGIGSEIGFHGFLSSFHRDSTPLEFKPVRWQTFCPEPPGFGRSNAFLAACWK